MNNYDVAILPSEMRYWIMMGCALFMGLVFIKSFDNIRAENRNDYLKRLGFAIITIQIFTIFKNLSGLKCLINDPA